MAAGALAGLKVLDLSRVLAGPWASQLLGDLGAEVIKVEKPGGGKGGDDTRGWGPPWLADGDGAPTTDAAYFLCTNRNKRSLTVDMTRPEGQAILRQLAAQSDVVLENFKVGGSRPTASITPASRAQPEARVLLDHRLRPGRPLRRACRLRLS
jgi:crotonobetainyl-CoA:carnitine CoA-transferase CaiB-like acyl-CoA transferase